jgi:RHS repeat-associated protein
MKYKAVLLATDFSELNINSAEVAKNNKQHRIQSFSGLSLINVIALSLTLAVMLPFPTPVFAVTQSYCELPDGDIDGDECITQNTAKNNGGDNPDCSTCSTTTADPINVATGSKYENEIDYVSTGSSPLVLSRSYNSADTSISTFGVSWRGSYSRSVSAPYYGTFIINGSYIYSNAVDVTRDDGKVLTFYQNGTQWLPDSDVNSKLIQLSNGWQYTTGLDEVEIYNANGQLTSVADRAGLTQNLGYDAQGHLISVTNPFGRSLSFAYTGSNVSSVTVPNGGVYAYSYDANNNLSIVTYPDKTQRKFVYENAAFPHALTGVIDENANRYSTDAYDSAGRDISNQLAGGVNQYTLDYSYLTYGYVPVKDALGVTRTSTFTNINQVALETLMSQSCLSCPAGYATTKSATSYDANGNIISQTDFNGNVTTYTYDTTRNLQLSRTEAAGTPQARTITTAWHATFRLPATITEPTKTTTFSYDKKGNLLQKTVTAGTQTKTWTFTYNANSQPLTIDGPRTDVTDVTNFSYDNIGNLSTITDALGHVTTITSYNADGKPLALKDANGLVTNFQYDARGKLISSTVGAEVTSYSYDAAGQLIKVTLPDASYLAYSYDNAHRLVSIADSLGNHINYTLDLMGNRLSTQSFDSTNALSKTRTQVFDGLSRLAKSIGAQNQTSQFGYDANGNTTSVADPLNNKTALAYDSLNRLISSIDPLGDTATSTYDSNNNPLALTDPLTHSTDYAYDGFGQKLTTTSPDTGLSQNSYDAAGNLISNVDARGQTVNYTYDALNRVTQISYASKPPVNFTYDQGVNGIGHLTLMADGTGTTATSTSWTYDIHGRVSSKTFKTGSLTLVTGYSYDAYGRLAKLTYPSGKVVQLSYNSNGQVIKLDNNGSPLISAIHYQSFGSATAWTFGNGVSTSRSFDLDGRITAYDLGNRSRQLTYDAAGRISGYTDTDLNHDQSFSYDALGRLISYIDPTTQTAYSYDANGNRVQVTGTPVNNYNTDTASNRLLSITDNNLQTVKKYSYDVAGNLLSDGYNTFTYDGRGRLVQASNVSLGVEQYLINGFGQRVAKINGSITTTTGDNDHDDKRKLTDSHHFDDDCKHDNHERRHEHEFHHEGDYSKQKQAIGTCGTGGSVQTGTYFVYDEAGHLLGEYTQNSTPVQETVWLGNTPVAVLSGSSQYYVYADHLNAPRAISDNTGTVIWRWDSEAFGTTAANEDPDGNKVTFTYNLRFPGQYFDKGTGLHYNGFRDYNPAIGRYIESDPIGLAGGINTYAYVYGNPISLTDPSGKIIPFILACAANPLCVEAVVGTTAFVGSIAYQLYENGGSFGDVNYGDSALLGLSAFGTSTGGACPYAAEEAAVANELNYTKTVLNNASTRPYISSPLTVKEITSSGTGIPDPGGIPGAIRFDAPGSFNGSQGIYELVIDPQSNTIYHLLFRSIK